MRGALGSWEFVSLWPVLTPSCSRRPVGDVRVRYRRTATGADPTEPVCPAYGGFVKMGYLLKSHNISTAKIVETIIPEG